jgi:uncharacterized protein DUF6603
VCANRGHGAARQLAHPAQFCVAIGSFNAHFPAPARFPQVARLALSLADIDNPRLRFETYLALTFNTVQFGARLDVSYSAAVFTLAGFLGFDALFQFAPFQFIADDGLNPRPTWESGATPGIGQTLPVSPCFNPRPTWESGATDMRRLMSLAPETFQSSPDLGVGRYGVQVVPLVT